jgi:Common central domain of tyrosinase
VGVNVFDVGSAGFMGSASGRAGAPLDSFDNGGLLPGSREQTRNPADPPREITRAVSVGNPPVPNDQATIAPDDWVGMRTSLEGAHDSAHVYIGGTIGRPHSSFEDPFVFLLHSNADRLWAGWQLERFGDTSRVSPRLDPARAYGVEQSSALIQEVMRPWGGQLQPWTTHPTLKTAAHRSVVAPPLYDKYPFAVGFAWESMFLALPLPDGDIIKASMVVNAVPPTGVEFVLESLPNVSWWKGATRSGWPREQRPDLHRWRPTCRSLHAAGAAREQWTGADLPQGQVVRREAHRLQAG